MLCRSCTRTSASGCVAEAPGSAGQAHVSPCSAGRHIPRAPASPLKAMPATIQAADRCVFLVNACGELEPRGMVEGLAGLDRRMAGLQALG